MHHCCWAYFLLVLFEIWYRDCNPLAIEDLWHCACLCGSRIVVFFLSYYLGSRPANLLLSVPFKIMQHYAFSIQSLVSFVFHLQWGTVGVFVIVRTSHNVNWRRAINIVMSSPTHCFEQQKLDIDNHLCDGILCSYFLW
jgi:hypothetical protein